MKEDGENVREQQGRGTSPQKIIRLANGAPKMTHGQVGSEEDKGEGKCAPSGKDTENLKGELHQIVAGGNNKKYGKAPARRALSSAVRQ